MMPGLDALYGAAFFAEWGKDNEPYARTARVLTDALVAELSPRRAADLGCGCGVYAHALRERGVEILALDGVTPAPEHSFPVPVVVRDLTEPVENEWGPFDLALCLEVAEHIPEELSGVFLDNLARFSDTIVLSAAPPHQKGHHHVNARPKRYWVRRLAALGYAYDRAASGRVFGGVLAVRPPNLWMAQQIGVYRRAPRAPGDLLPFGVRLG
jgi:hypothetical protein